MLKLRGSVGRSQTDRASSRTSSRSRPRRPSRERRCHSSTASLQTSMARRSSSAGAVTASRPPRSRCSPRRSGWSSSPSRSYRRTGSRSCTGSRRHRCRSHRSRNSPGSTSARRCSHRRGRRRWPCRHTAPRGSRWNPPVERTRPQWRTRPRSCTCMPESWPHRSERRRTGRFPCRMNRRARCSTGRPPGTGRYPCRSFRRPCCPLRRRCRRRRCCSMWRRRARSSMSRSSTTGRCRSSSSRRGSSMSRSSSLHLVNRRRTLPAPLRGQRRRGSDAWGFPSRGKGPAQIAPPKRDRAGVRGSRARAMNGIDRRSRPRADSN